VTVVSQKLEKKNKNKKNKNSVEKKTYAIHPGSRARPEVAETRLEKN